MLLYEWGMLIITGYGWRVGGADDWLKRGK